MDQLTERDQVTAAPATHARFWSLPLAIAFATSVAATSGAMMLYPVLPAIAADLAVDKARIGLVMATYTAPAIVLAPLFGIIADLYGRRWMLIGGLAVFGLAGGAVALASSFDWVLVIRALQGIGASALSPLTIVLISDILPEDQEIHGQGTKVAIDRVAMIILPLTGGMLVALSWRAAFLPFLATAVLAVIAYMWMPETNTGESDSLKQYLGRTARALREPRLTIAFMTGFLRFFLDYGLFTYLPLLVALHYGASATMAGWLIAASAVGSIVTATNIGRIHRRHSAERLLALAFLLSGVGLAIIALSEPLWVLAIASFLFGLGNGLISPLQKSLLTRRTSPSLRGGVVSVDRVIQQVAKSLAPSLLGALLLVAPLEALFWVLCVLCVLAMLILAWIGFGRGHSVTA